MSKYKSTGIMEWSFVYLSYSETYGQSGVSISHMAPHSEVHICLCSTFVLDFANIASGKRLLVNSVHMWANCNKKWPQPF